MERLTLVTYTHSSCANLHLPYFKRIDKYFPSLRYNLVTSDKEVGFGRCILYNNDESYSEQMIRLLDEAKTEYVIYSQEDYILFAEVQHEKILMLMNLMDEDQSISFIRLICSGVNNMNLMYSDNLAFIETDSKYFFSTQATLWRKEILKKMFQNSRVRSIFDEPLNSFSLKKINAIGLYTIEKGDKVGGHYNSVVYPYIATARVKGEWNFKEYPNELKELFYEFDIKG